MTEVLSQDEIDQLLTAINAGDANTDSDSFKPTTDSRKIKIYDFKRPDKFSKEQIRTVQIMHETFARLTTTSLSANLRSMVHVHVASVDQLTYEEFIRSIPTPTTLAIINMDPLKGNSILEIDPAITFSIIDRLFGGTGEGSKIIHELTDIEQSVMEGIIVRILGNMREAWAQVIDLRPRLGQIDTNPQFAQIVPPTEMVILVTLETKVGEVEGMMNFCIPYLTIEPIISKLSAQFWYSTAHQTASTENLNVLKDKLVNVDVNVVAEIGKIEVPVGDVLALQAGDVIRLYNVKVGDPFSLTVGSIPKFQCKPGVIGRKMAVQITKKLADLEDDDFEELISEGEDLL
jgi:flagellar motor switch protein FliM